MNTKTHKIFAYRLNQAVADLGWNLSDLARRVNITPQAVQKWAKGTSAPRGEKLKALSDATGKPEHWFFMAPDSDDADLNAQLDIPRKLDETEEVLLSIFNQLPEAEKLRLILHAKGVLRDLKSLRDDVNDLIKNIQD
ncbi:MULTISPECIES: helix-turn-helix domain-containing protein [Klebsiella/Raoultella group]|uniref:helix-turn-helix domain-containing protein n=1 Tax=Klebsiella/Raoultella group TaxID=2890311 RepID=UPI0012AD6353|nr:MULTISPECIES: helix-turn-helix domain-containing protein [Klebsiella/Raoultella group]EKR9386043.1 helix-turn-helix domain-containing protein [Raoultella ornithinolytica]MBZ6730242.1 helix-turn-helix domain-containing protein [Klebsiella grimontii]MBZ7384254.1 helix-turn-helix domain-containing protein [Klebsiella grimontii]MRT51992.1 helix-turn-helix domain-containing protein [Raoultella sp. RIT712]HBH8226312.1 helix-turn-helix domain-containing protein [Raoultella ornithinolytica]